MFFLYLCLFCSECIEYKFWLYIRVFRENCSSKTQMHFTVLTSSLRFLIETTHKLQSRFFVLTSYTSRVLKQTGLMSSWCPFGSASRLALLRLRLGSAWCASARLPKWLVFQITGTPYLKGRWHMCAWCGYVFNQFMKYLQLNCLLNRPLDPDYPGLRAMAMRRIAGLVSPGLAGPRS